MPSVPPLKEIKKKLEFREALSKLENRMFYEIRLDRDFHRNIAEKTGYYELFEYYQLIVAGTFKGVVLMIGKSIFKLGSIPRELIEYHYGKEMSWESFFADMKEHYEYETPYHPQYNPNPAKNPNWRGGDTPMLIMFFLRVEGKKKQKGLSKFPASKTKSEVFTPPSKPLIPLKSKKKGLDNFLQESGKD